MSYFSEQYSKLAYPLASNPGGGLYNAQVGAIHGLASHFTVEERPAIVTMPTGSGKTAVLMMTPFIVRSTRVIVVTPSRLVRGQISEDFRRLRTLREIGVLPDEVDLPRVVEIRERIHSAAEWEELRGYDVVIGTPNCLSPGYEGIPPPPEDLFDLLLIDEAHHSPAETWTALLDSLKATKRVLFTATPFRRDRAEIPGRFVYNYPIAQAYEDRIFGPIAFEQVESSAGDSSDVAIARRTAAVFEADRAAGLRHCVMVRTDRKSRAEELATLYQAQTSLRLKVVHSGYSNRTVKGVLSELERGELDGIICVNMMGEGVDFPRLKIAAVHSPHRSLEVTLQFIGRFARTNAPDIGEAKFVAVLNEIEIERKRLFDEGAVWQKIIPELSYGRIASEIHTREVIQEFADPATADVRLADLSLYSLRPRSHVKIYDVRGSIDLRRLEIPSIGGWDVSYRNSSADGAGIVLITRAVGAPKWSAGDAVVNVTFELFVVYYDRETRLLFINSSRSVDGTYEEVARAVSESATPVATGEVGRVVRDINNKRIFNVGMRNIYAANTRESYKIIAGSDTQIDPNDARRYRQGHVFLTGEEHGERKTIGYSSGAKVWSSSSGQIPELLDWCKALGQKIRNTGPVVTHSGLDYLDAGQVVGAIPERLIYVQWNRDAFDFTVPILVEYTKADGTPFQGHILDLDLVIDRAQSSRERVRVVVSGDGLETSLDFSLEEFYTSVGGEADRISVVRGNDTASLTEYLNESYLDFYTAEGALFSGNELFEPKDDARPILAEQLTAWEWTEVDIKEEVTAAPGRQSIHAKVRGELERSAASIILYDHGTGEIADFLTITEEQDTTVLALYHCKGSEASIAGARVDDVYEVCGQAQKSVAWTSLARLERRLRDRPLDRRLVRGTRAQLQELLERAKSRRQRFEIKVVQPGISKERLSAAMAECLGATNGHLVGVGIAPLEVITSA